MTLEPGMTLNDLLLRLATTLAVTEVDSDGNESLPSDAALLSRMKRAVGDGIGRMRRDNPVWYCLRRKVTLNATEDGTDAANVGEDPTRFALPWFVAGSFSTTWYWRAVGDSDTRRGTVVATADKVVAERNGTGSTGHPELVAIVPGETAGSWELHLAPEPDGDYTLEADCELLGFVPTQLYHRSPFGAVHDQTVLAAARFMFVDEDAADPRRDRFREAYLEGLAMSKEFDERLGAPRSLGRISDPGCEQPGAFSPGSPLRQPVTYITV